MGNWETRPLGEICVVNPKLKSVEMPDEDTEVTFVSMAAVDEGTGTISRAEVRSYREVAKGYTAFREHDVLFAKITPCMQNGKATIARRLNNGLGFGSTEFHVLRASEDVLPEWILAFVRQPSFRAAAEASFTGSAGQQRVPAEFMKQFPIPVPAKAEQERIVKLLDEADALRKLRAKTDRRTADLIPALFHEMFGDFSPSRGRWPVHPLGELIANGPQNGLYKHSSFYGVGTPILRIDAFYDGEVEDPSALKRLRATGEEVERYGLRENDFVINRVNSPDYLGKSAIIPALAEPTVFESNMMRFSISLSEIEPGYLIRFLQTSAAKQHILGRAKHSINQSSINQEDVRSIPVPVPPLALQQEFALHVTEIRALEAEQAASRRRLDDLFQSMLHRAFNGEL